MRSLHAVLGLVKDGRDSRYAIPGIHTDSKWAGDGTGESMVWIIEKNSWQLLAYTAFLVVMLMTSVVLWWLGYD